MRDNHPVSYDIYLLEITRGSTIIFTLCWKCRYFRDISADEKKVNKDYTFFNYKHEQSELSEIR